MKSISLLIIISQIWVCLAGAPPFIEADEIHDVKSEFEFNLILNENRHYPIIMIQYSRDKTIKKIKGIVESALEEQKGICFGMLIDCRDFKYDMNNTLGVCKGWKDYTPPPELEDEDPDKMDDDFLMVEFFSPNPTRITEKGHVISKPHDTQNLRKVSDLINVQLITKVIRNEIPDFVTYLEDQLDLDEFLGLKSNFRRAKGPKLLYFDQNLQSPLFLKKAAVTLDGWIRVGVADSSRLAKTFGASFDDLLLLEFDFESGRYQARKISQDQEDSLSSILDSKHVKAYTSIRKPRDILLDFEHKQPLIHNLTNLRQVNQLITHGRIIILQISSQNSPFDCPNLQKVSQIYGVLFNYACFHTKGVPKLLEATQTKTQEWSLHVFMIDGSLKNSKLLRADIDLIHELPSAQARQKISTTRESDMCVSGARAMGKEMVFFYYSEKTHADAIRIMKYFNSLEQVNSLIHFCQFYLPDEDVTRDFQLQQNSIFTLRVIDESKGSTEKIQQTDINDFFGLKMFVRELGISHMIRVYQRKMLSNEIRQLTTSTQLSENCFSSRCVIGILETGSFHAESAVDIMKEMQIQFSEDFKFFWIDGKCHYEIPKQLKLIPKDTNAIDRSYLIGYAEKSRQYALHKGSSLNKFWDKKEAIRWAKSLRNGNNFSRIKFTLDFEDKKCPKIQIKGKKAVKDEPRRPQGQVLDDQL